MGWAVHGTLHHYSVHSVLDIQHSAGLFSIVDVSRCPEDMLRFREGLVLGACMFRSLYESIYRPGACSNANALDSCCLSLDSAS